MDDLENNLNALLESLLEACIVINDFQPESTDLMYQKVNEIVQHYRSIDNIKDGLTTHVPLDVINLIDEAKNPDLFNRDFVDRLAAENQFTNGKVSAVADLRDVFAKELSEQFPHLRQEVEKTVSAEQMRATDEKIQKASQPAVKIEDK